MTEGVPVCDDFMYPICDNNLIQTDGVGIIKRAFNEKNFVNAADIRSI